MTLKGMDEPHYLEGGKVVVFKRPTVKKPVWNARFALNGHPRYIWRSLDTVDLATAKIAALDQYAEIKFKLKHGLPITSKTVEQVSEEFLEEQEVLAAAGKESEHMLRNNRKGLRYWNDYVGRKLVHSLTQSDIDGYILWRLDYWKGRDKPPTAKLTPSDRTLEWEFGALRRCLNWATKKGFADRDKLPSIEFKPRTRNKRPALTKLQYGKLLRYLLWENENVKGSAVRHYRKMLRTYVLFMLHSGLRVGEARNLRWRDLEKFVQADGRANYYVTVNGKTGTREVIPHPIARKQLDKWRTETKFPGLDDFIFCNDDSQPIHDMREGFNTLIRNAGIERSTDGRKITIYSLRHTYATFRIRYGKRYDIFILAANMGTSVDMIRHYYGQIKPRDAVERLTTYFSGLALLGTQRASAGLREHIQNGRRFRRPFKLRFMWPVRAHAANAAVRRRLKFTERSSLAAMRTLSSSPDTTASLSSSRVGTRFEASPTSIADFFGLISSRLLP